MPHSPKRILIFSLVYYPRYIGGAEVAVKEITDRIPSEEYVFDMVTMDKTGPRYEQIGNVHIHRVGNTWLNKTKLLGKLYKYLFIIVAFRKAVTLHRQRPYDAIWSIMANYAGFAALFFKLRFPRVPFLLTLQEGDPIPYIKRRVALVYPLFKMIFRKADAIQAISHYLARFAIAMGFQGLPTVVPNGVDIAHFSQEVSKEDQMGIRKKYGFKDGDIVLVTASRLVKKNGVKDIIDSLAFLPPHYKVFVLGTGKLETGLRKRAEQFGDRVVFAGFVPHAQLPLYLKASDVFVRPSLSEGLGNSFIEAMAAQIPVVATSVGGIPDFLFDGKTGLFCDVQNPKNLAEKVQLFENKEMKSVIVDRAYRMAVELYGWNEIAPLMEKQFAGVCSRDSVSV